jgi:predicted 3-demethylubiquinone-9 3-methyltransferase (glyoxalase superfamily)
MKNHLTPCLWFNDDGEQAVEFYKTVFKDVTVRDISRYGEGAPLPAGTALTILFEIAGQEIMILNGGPSLQLNEAFSLYVDCADQAEVDRYWDALTDGGEESMCGWLKDRFGVSWQIVPRRLSELLNDADPEKAGRVMQAMLQMQKIDVPALEAAYHGA